jgi:hypothetical protein
MSLLASRPGVGEGAGRTAVSTTPHFAFHSDFDFNLNDALIAAGLARKPGKPELFHSGPEGPCFDKLPESLKAGWDGAVDYYARVISPAGSNGEQQYLLRVQMAGFDEDLKDTAARQFVEIARGFRSAAAPAYRACRCIVQDEKNRRWIEGLKSNLSAQAEKNAGAGGSIRGSGRLPIPVDVGRPWTGAEPTRFSDPPAGTSDLSGEREPLGPRGLHEASTPRWDAAPAAASS